MLYDINSTVMLRGCFFNSPHLIMSDKFRIDDDDIKYKGVEESKFYNVLYRASYNLAQQGASEIDEVMIDMFLQDYPKQLEICKEYDHMNFITTTKQLAKSQNIEIYYTNVRKYSMLREYKKEGYSISDIYDELKDEQSQKNKLNTVTLKDIADHFALKQTQIKQKFVENENVEHYVVGKDFKYIKEKFKESPMIGLPFQSGYLNQALNGIQGLVIRSASSGVGKSLMSVADCCMSSCKYLYDFEQKDFIKNKSYIAPSLFINTELDPRTELDPMFEAFVSGVPRNHITRGEYEEGEEDRVDKANEYIQDSVYAVTMPDYTCGLLEETIEEYVLKHNVRLVVFDYIHTNTAVGNEISKEMQLPAREDLVLQEVTTRLKTLSLKHKIEILTSTQLNRKAQEDNGSPDESFIAGSIGIVRKVNSCMIMQPITKKMRADIEAYEYQLSEDNIPTHVTTIIKGRNSATPKFCRVYQQMDLGTGRSKDIFMLTKELDPIDIEPLTIVGSE